MYHRMVVRLVYCVRQDYDGTGECGIFQLYGNLITNDARCTCKIAPAISSIQEEVEEDSFHQQIGLKSKEQTNKVR